MFSYVVYIITNKKNGVLYVGLTNDLRRRMIEHGSGVLKGFTQKYKLKKLVYFEQFEYINDALYREKRLKKWPRQWKINLIVQNNPMWLDLYEKTFGPIDDEYYDWILKRAKGSNDK